MGLHRGQGEKAALEDALKFPESRILGRSFRQVPGAEILMDFKPARCGMAEIKTARDSGDEGDGPPGQ